MSPEPTIAAAIADRMANASARPLVVGLCGAQGSGKSTIARALGHRFARSAIMSLDDLYLKRAERTALAREVHSLFATRGVPGTHDIALGLAVLTALKAGEPVALPRFDKAVDDRLPRQDWPVVSSPCDLVLLEGWCVGALPQNTDALATPVNALERVEDAEGRWRRAVNTALAETYQSLFAEIDMLILLAAPGWETVGCWRREQEVELRKAAPGGIGVMNDAAILRFVSHYERLTRHILDEMPSRADIVINLDAHRGSIRGTRIKDKFR